MHDEPERARVEALFEAALALRPEERATFLAGAAGEDGALHAAVLALLHAHARAGGILEQELSRARDPERIGPYRVLDLLGRGGMGVVYLGERDDGQYRQRVALKVIRADGDPELPARMVAERQILATLDHPNIAKLLDGGVLPDGRPYLVMEHVPGMPIDTYCDRMRLSVPERLRLFATVARAVDHAHRNLVVHRDLKPSNILVTADGRPKLLDFGIAKLLNPMLAGVQVPVTRTERRVLTPEYASPEQLRGDALTTASDVYSLGIVLYRLLCGVAPYRAGPSAMAMLTTMLEDDPAAPSGRVLEQVDSVARDRHTTPDRLRRMLRGDLDAIVLKALRREPSRRYGSAEQLARDVDAYLNGDAVLAHRGSGWYRAQKIMRRHKAAALAAAVVVVALVLGAGGATWQAGVARHERDRAEDARVQAQTVTDFLMELFRTGGDAAPDGDVTAATLLRRGVDRADELASQPLVQARMLDVVGQMNYGLGRFEEAETLLRRSVSLHRAAGERARGDLAAALIHLSWVRRARAQLEDAATLVGEALEIRRTDPDATPLDIAEALFELGWLRAGPPQEALFREALAHYRRNGGDVERQAAMMHELATNLRRQGRVAEALSTDREALEVARAALGDAHPATAYAMIHLADQVRDLRGDGAEAERLYRRGLAVQEQRHGEHSVELMHGINSLATLLSDRGDLDAAESLLRRGLAIRESSTGPHHPAVAGSLTRLADVLHRQGRLDEAERLAGHALDLYRGLLGDDHPSVASALVGLAGVHAAQGRLDTAMVSMGRAVDLLDRLVDRTPVGQTYRTMGLLLLEYEGAGDAAEAALLRSFEELDDALGPEHPNTLETRRALMRLYEQRGRADLVERYHAPPGRFIAY